AGTDREQGRPPGRVCRAAGRGRGVRRVAAARRRRRRRRAGGRDAGGGRAQPRWGRSAGGLARELRASVRPSPCTRSEPSAMSTVPRIAPRDTHDVINQSEPFVDVNWFDSDVALQEALAREGGGWGVDRIRDFGQVAGSAEADEHRRRAQRNIPQLHQHDRFGHRVDEVEYDPSMHWMLRLGVEREVNSLPWRDPRPGAHVVRYGLFYLMNQLDTGPCCPMSINY